MQWGYTCSSEEFGASALVAHAERAEESGFSFVTVSDHFHPWVEAQGHSPFAWTTVGGIAARTASVRIGTGVTCPLIRIHPAIVAQAAATSSELSSGRFFLGVGTGEALNEHVVGTRWPPIEQRQQMLIEAVGIMRALWAGETVDVAGTYFTVENARLFTRPHGEIEVVWAAGGPTSASLAAEHADGLWVTSPSHDVIGAYRDAGGSGRVIGQISVCWGPAERARRTAFEQWPNAALGGQLSQDLPTWTHFRDAAALADEDDVAERVVCGDDVDRIVQAVSEYAAAGVTDVHFHQIGPDQDEFLDAWAGNIRAALNQESAG